MARCFIRQGNTFSTFYTRTALLVQDKEITTQVSFYAFMIVNSYLPYIYNWPYRVILFNIQRYINIDSQLYMFQYRCKGGSACPPPLHMDELDTLPIQDMILSTQSWSCLLMSCLDDLTWSDVITWQYQHLHLICTIYITQVKLSHSIHHNIDTLTTCLLLPTTY